MSQAYFVMVFTGNSGRFLKDPSKINRKRRSYKISNYYVRSNSTWKMIKFDSLKEARESIEYYATFLWSNRNRVKNSNIRYMIFRNYKVFETGRFI